MCVCVMVRVRVTVRVRVRGRVMVMVVCVLKLIQRHENMAPWLRHTQSPSRVAVFTEQEPHMYGHGG